MPHPATTAAKEGSNMDERLILARKIRRVSISYLNLVPIIR
jgi:hypothetical protein